MPPLSSYFFAIADLVLIILFPTLLPPSKPDTSND